jgi:hypothetical protein
MNMNEYDDDLRKLQIAESTEIVSNSSTDHARALVARLVGSAKEQVVVFSGSLNPKIYSDPAVIDAFGAFLLGRNGELKIVVQTSAVSLPDGRIVSDADCMIAQLRLTYGDAVLARVKVARASDHDSRTYSVHFLVVDDRGFRLEPDNTLHKALGSFNQPQLAAKLHEAFSSLFARAAPISLN